jgi:hypothetical protein
MQRTSAMATFNCLCNVQVQFDSKKRYIVIEKIENKK